MSSQTLYFSNPRLLSQLYCDCLQNIEKVEQTLKVNIVTRENWVQINGDPENIARAATFFQLLEKSRNQGFEIKVSDFDSMLSTVADGREAELLQLFENPLILQFETCSIVPKTLNQKYYLKAIAENEIVFGIGPAGTGKTYLAVAAAIQALLQNEVEKIIITRPAVEAGEALGYLPGDLQEKILPYLRPLYDALYQMLSKETTERMIDKGIIEIAPLAYMRGRTLSRAFILLDEAQNTTPEQMIMFLTRLGDGSRMLITGDITQIDLPNSRNSGLKQAIKVLDTVQGIQCFFFENRDVVRHRLVQKIIEAYNLHRSQPIQSMER